MQSGLNSDTPQQYHQMSSVVGPSLCIYFDHFLFCFDDLLLWNHIQFMGESVCPWGAINDRFMGTSFAGKSFVNWFVGT